MAGYGEGSRMILGSRDLKLLEMFNTSPTKCCLQIYWNRDDMPELSINSYKYGIPMRLLINNEELCNSYWMESLHPPKEIEEMQKSLGISIKEFTSRYPICIFCNPYDVITLTLDEVYFKETMHGDVLVDKTLFKEASPAQVELIDKSANTDIDNEVTTVYFMRVPADAKGTSWLYFTLDTVLDEIRINNTVGWVRKKD